ncbi:MAG: elongation factor G [Gammaproteobacteria bacterium]
MPSYTTDDIHNIALVGHGGSGKTLLAEALLHAAGAIPSPGSLERGTTVCDFDPEEKEYQHSLSSAVASFDYQKRLINLIDTPGYPDFIGQAYAALEAVETVAVVVNAQTGIELVTRRMLERAAEERLCRIIVINKIDGENVDLGALLQQIRDTFGSECLPINLPAKGFSEVVDCFFNPSGESDISSVEAAHTEIIDQVVEVDEELMAVYLDQGEVSPAQLHDPFEKALREGHLIPICFTSAKTGAGVRELLDILVKLMPNPHEGNPHVFIRHGEEHEEEFIAEHDPDKHVLAHVFKVTTDPFVGKMGIFRIHQGTVRADSQLYIGESRKPFKVGHLYRLLGKETIEIPEAAPGEICAVAKVDDIYFDAVLHDAQEDAGVSLRPMEFPQPMHGLAIETDHHGDDQKLSKALAMMSAEDPSFVVEHSPATNETVIRGLGELHLRMVLERMKNRYNVEVKTRPPRIAYRETVRAPAEGHHRHKKQTGGAGQFGEVFLRIAPLERGAGFSFVDKVVGGAIPGQFIPAVEKGVRQAMESGYLAGYPLQDIEVTVYDGKHHPVDSKEVAFVTAGKKAFLDAVSKAKPVLLEPVVRIEITVPEENMGDISGDLSGRRGRISNTDSMPGGLLNISGEVPLAEIADYQSFIKSVTGGQGSYSIEFSHYEEVPANIQKAIVEEYKSALESA